jgi:hypothetical protein
MPATTGTDHVRAGFPAPGLALTQFVVKGNLDAGRHHKGTGRLVFCCSGFYWSGVRETWSMISPGSTCGNA